MTLPRLVIGAAVVPTAFLLVSTSADWPHAAATVVKAQSAESPPVTDESPDVQPNQGQVFRAGTNLVYVDAYPRRDGAIVEGLAGTDFRLFEDNVAQTIELIDFVRVPSGGSDPFEPEPTSQRESDELAADPSNRLFVIYLDLYHTSRTSSYQTHRDLIDFVTRRIGPKDLVAVLTQEMLVSQLAFSRRASDLVSLLIGNPSWGRADEAGSGVALHGEIEERIASCEGANYDALVRAWRNELLFSSLENLVARLGDLREARKNVIFVSEGWAVPGNFRRSGNRGAIPFPRPPLGIGRGGNRFGPTDIVVADGRRICDEIAAQLGGTDYYRRFLDLLRRAQAGNVAFYPVDIGGLRVATPAARRAETFRTLAENTDGRAILDQNDIGLGLQQIVEDLSSYYVLGYTSTNDALDGRFRSIEVTMNRPGVSVTARRGYFGAVDGRPSPDALAIAEARKPVDEALSQLTRSDRLTDVAAYGVAVNEGLFLVMELIGQDARDAWRAGGEIVAVVTDNGGREWRGVGRLDVGASSAAVSVALDTTRGPWRVTLGLEGHDDVDLGAVFTVEAACCLPMVFRGAASSQAPVRPTAVFTFRRTERLRLEWPGSDAAGGFAARLLDRQGRPLIEALPMRDGGAVDAAMVVTDIPLGSLAAGDYVVEATDIAQLHAPRRLFAFRVLR